MTRKSRRRKKRRFRFHRQTQPGASPGTVKVREDAPRSVVRVLAYGPDRLVDEQLDDFDRLSDLLGTFPVVWVNVDGLGDEATIRKLGEIFGLHSLALEDVVNVHQRPKVEEYADHLFIVLRMVHFNDSLETEQVGLFLGKNFVVTFQEHEGDCLEPVRQRIKKSQGKIRKVGADYLAYALLDAVVDSYFPIVETYGERLEALDDVITSNGADKVMHEIHNVRGDLLVLRRAIRPLRDSLVQMLPDPHELFTEPTHFFLRDCYDHTVQLIDLLDIYREMCSDLRDFHLTSVSNRMNEIMKVLTIIATIFIPLSFIAGVYGMNFDPDRSPWNMPELEWYAGYPFALAIMLAVAIGMVIYFWRKGWLSAPEVLKDESTTNSNAKHGG